MKHDPAKSVRARVAEEAATAAAVVEAAAVATEVAVVEAAAVATEVAVAAVAGAIDPDKL
jgi:hypothetical protein